MQQGPPHQASLQGLILLLLHIMPRPCLGHLFTFPSAHPAAEMLLLGPNPAEPNPTPPHSPLGCC